jgi:hypothetical protein
LATALTVASHRPAVKLSGDTQTGIKGDTLPIQHRASLVAALDLTDAIRMAQMVLRYAEQCGIDISAAASDISAAGEDASDDYPSIF